MCGGNGVGCNGWWELTFQLDKQLEGCLAFGIKKTSLESQHAQRNYTCNRPTQAKASLYIAVEFALNDIFFE